MTARATFRQSDLERAVRVALKHGLAVKVVRDGAFLIPPAMIPVAPEDDSPKPAEPKPWPSTAE